MKKTLMAILVLSTGTLLAQNAPAADGEPLSTARVPENLKLRGVTIVSAAPVTLTNVTVVSVSPLVAAAAKSRKGDGAQVQITDKDLKRSEGKIIGMTSGTPVAEVKMPEGSQDVIEKHDIAMSDWQRGIRMTSQSVQQLEDRLREARASAGTLDERISNADDPAVMEGLEASRSSVYQNLEQTRKQLETERSKLESMKSNPPRID